MKYIQYYNSPIGIIGVIEENEKIIRVLIREKAEEIVEKETEVLKKAILQLKEYFEKSRTEFDLPLEPVGTEFQKKVWEALQEIPYGETRSYKQIAERIGNPKACRAVGMANNRNHIAIFIPCHRVIGANGDLVGYEGGVDIKEALLKLEGVI